MNKNIYFASVLVICQVYGGAPAGGGDASGVVREVGSIIKGIFGESGGKDGAAGASGSSGSGIMNFGGGAAAGAAGIPGAGGIPGLPAGLPGAGAVPPPGGSIVYNITNNTADNRQTVNVGADGKPIIPGQPMKDASGQVLKDSSGAPILAPQPTPQPGQPMKDASGQNIIDPTTNQPVLVPAGGLVPGAAVTGSNGQPIINPQTGQPYTAPQALQPGAPLLDAAGKPVVDSSGKPVIMPSSAGSVSIGGFSGGATAGAVVGTPLNDSILSDPNQDPVAYKKLLDSAMEDPETAKALKAIHDEMPERLAPEARAPILRKFLMDKNAEVAKAAEVEQLRQEAIRAAAEREARERAEAARRELVKKEIDRLNGENQRIIKNLQSLGVSPDEISTIMASSREKALYRIPASDDAGSDLALGGAGAGSAPLLPSPVVSSDASSSASGASIGSLNSSAIAIDRSKLGNTSAIKALGPPPQF